MWNCLKIINLKHPISKRCFSSWKIRAEKVWKSPFLSLVEQFCLGKRLCKTVARAIWLFLTQFSRKCAKFCRFWTLNVIDHGRKCISAKFQPILNRDMKKLALWENTRFSLEIPDTRLYFGRKNAIFSRKKTLQLSFFIGGPVNFYFYPMKIEVSVVLYFLSTIIRFRDDKNWTGRVLKNFSTKIFFLTKKNE